MILEAVLEHIKSSGIHYSSYQLNVFARDGTRLELMHHYFKSPTVYPPYMNIFVFKKIDKDVGPPLHLHRVHVKYSEDNGIQIEGSRRLTQF